MSSQMGQDVSSLRMPRRPPQSYPTYPTVQSALAASSSKQFATIKTDSGTLVYSEYGRQVTQTQFQTDYESYIARQEAAGAASPRPSFFTLPSNAPMSQQAQILQTEQAYLGTIRPDTSNPYSVGEYNALVQQYNQNVSAYGAEVARANQYLASLPNEQLTGSQVLAGFQQYDIAVSPQLNQFLSQNAQSRVTVTRAPADIFNPAYGGSTYSFSTQQAQTTSRISPPPTQFVGTLERGFNAVALGVGYAGFGLSLAPRELYSLATTGRPTQIPLPSQETLTRAGSFGIETGAATAVGFVVGPAAAAILPEGAGLITTIATRAGVSAALGGGFGAATSALSGGDVLKGAAYGAIGFAGSYAAFEAGGYLLSKVFPNFGIGATDTRGAKLFAQYVSQKLGTSPYAASNQEFMSDLTRGYQNQEILPPESEVVEPTGRQTSSTVLIQRVEQTPVVQQQTSLDYVRQQTAYETQLRINRSRGIVLDTTYSYLTTPDQYRTPVILDIFTQSPQSITTQNLGLIRLPDLISLPSLDIGAIQSVGLSQVQRSVQVQQTIQVQQQDQLQSLVLDTGLLSALKLDFEFQFDYAPRFPSPTRQRRRSKMSRREPRFLDFVRPNQISENVLGEPSIARIGQLIFG